MSICPFYQRGNCRFGNRCRLAHEGAPRPHGHFPSDPPFRPRAPHRPNISNYRRVAPSSNHPVNSQDTAGSNKANLAAVIKWTKENFADSEKALDILEEIQREAKVWQNSGHLWRFTTKSLFPGGLPLEGWQNQSFEEVKWAHRWMTDQSQGHLYKKSYNDYYENIVRQLNELARLKLERVQSLKPHIEQYVASNYKPAKTLATDVEMQEIDAMGATKPVVLQAESTNYTPDDELLEAERAAYGSDIFQFGNIPRHAPSREFVDNF